MLISCFCTGCEPRTSKTNTHSAFDVVVLVSAPVIGSNVACVIGVPFDPWTLKPVL